MGADFDQISLTLRSGLDEPDDKAALTALAIVTDFDDPDDIDTYRFYAELGKEDLCPDGPLRHHRGHRSAGPRGSRGPGRPAEVGELMKTLPPSFITWLLTLTGDPGPIGDLARDVESDRAYDCLPTTISTVTQGASCTRSGTRSISATPSSSADQVSPEASTTTPTSGSVMPILSPASAASSRRIDDSSGKVMTIRYDGLESIQNIRNEISGA